MRAFSGYTRRRPDRSHGGVLNLHTEGFFRLLCLSCSLSSICLSLFLSLLLSSLLFSLSIFPLLSSLSSLFPLLSSLSTLSETMTMITRPVGLSLCTHGSDLPFGPHVPWLTVWRTCSHHARNNCLSTPVQASCHVE